MPEKISLGFIGGGELVMSMLEILTKRLTEAEIYVSDHKEERCRFLNENYRVTASVGAKDFAGKVQVLVLAVKPKDARQAMREAAALVKPDTLIASVIAGLSLADIEKNFPAQQAAVRLMPNVAQSVGEGMTAFALGKAAGNEAKIWVERIWGALGKTMPVSEGQMDGVTGLSGSGPAFVFTAIEALADGGVAAGLPRSVALKLATQTVLGAAKMVEVTGLHPAALKDKVTSPGGTTITGLRELERGGFRSALTEAVVAAAARSAQLGKN